MKKLLLYINKLTPFIIALIIAQLLAAGTYFFLPKYYVTQAMPQDYTLEFKNYAFDDAFALKPKREKKQQKTQKPAYDLKDLDLQAVYKTRQNGFIVILDKKSKKTAILSEGESYKGYTLQTIGAKEAVFTKDGNNYRIQIAASKNAQKAYTPAPKDPTPLPDESVSIQKKQIQQYTDNFQAIWDNIVIDRHKKDGQIQGYEIKNINTNSIFGKLGLKKGDIITKINGNELTSDTQAFKVYNNINSYEYLVITVQRNGQERNLEYEVN